MFISALSVFRNHNQPALYITTFDHLHSSHSTSSGRLHESQSSSGLIESVTGEVTPTESVNSDVTPSQSVGGLTQSSFKTCSSPTSSTQSSPDSMSQSRGWVDSWVDIWMDSWVSSFLDSPSSVGFSRSCHFRLICKKSKHVTRV